MKKYFHCLLVLAFALWTAQSNAAEVAGVKLDDKAKLGNSELVLNGAGLRTKVFFKVYVIGLYLPAKAASGEAVLAQKGSKRAQLSLVRDVGPEDFSDALIDGLKNNSSDAEFSAMKPRIDQFRQAIVAAGDVKSGSVVHLDFLPESGTRLTIGGKQLGKDIPGEDFFNALLRIWIGDKPIQDNLKEALLGKPQ
ncbi:MAG: hypothetical protein EFKGCFLK_00508 [Rhodocyclaceae bacterium]|nr:MAG: hypothetical protein F9K21_08255 [Rhodocyclaceae bacterium]MBV6406960.1 hypothetical protein [Rhodocyclaceae bacterium]CAG0945529.1 hypothetical protein GPROT2_03262 [Gammaproteobacteria bacterium]